MLVVRIHAFSHRNFDEKVEAALVVVVKRIKIGCFQEIIKSRSDGPGVRVGRAARSIIKVRSMALFFPNSRSMAPHIPIFKLNDGREIPSLGFGEFFLVNFKRLK